jgi:hypothetical protein
LQKWIQGLACWNRSEQAGTMVSLAQNSKKIDLDLVRLPTVELYGISLF